MKKTTAKPSLSHEERAALLFDHMKFTHNQSKLARKFNKSEWLAAMVTALKATS